MTMRLTDVITACRKAFNAIPLETEITEVIAALDGIVFHDNKGNRWKYFYMTQEVEKLGYWRDNINKEMVSKR